MKPTLLVLAAGMGSRYGGLKQMDPMGPNGETVLDYSVYDAIRAGFGKVVFIIREDFADAFRSSVGARFAGKIEVDYAFQKLEDLPEGFSVPEGRTKPWGTAHAVRAARHVVDGPFAVINADDFYGADAYQSIARWFGGSAEEAGKDHYSMVGYPLKNTLSEHGSVNRGICQTDAGGLLTDVEEVVDIARDEDGIVRGIALDGSRREIADICPVSMNFWGFTRSFFDQIEEHFTSFLTEKGGEQKSECYIPTVVDDLIRHEKADCRVLDTTSSWFGVTYPEDKPHVVASIAKLVEKGDYPSPLG
ncbi:sugar phosphate nucleotidyltransferase [Luteolibacter sp. GHJ8]|uniref:Sugar phosphate nucleotidyltransferase n=1 Tax=Luteolibacter rhizosphaerae TaxID=2989719 RepID=A0ABT3FXQ1_9BACT|nr:sugar phosphate nucleotidyltransferase [Luteolibacter rhizosphaerae]MCW1912352.1 sugar phosphate nucleotidyltransferase [Luteolibacter rhizosphaerae]